MGSFDIGWAIRSILQGEKIRRKKWAEQGKYIVFMSGLDLQPAASAEVGPKVNDRTSKFVGEDISLKTLPYIAMYRGDGTWQPGWLASQEDLLATDYEEATNLN